MVRKSLLTVTSKAENRVLLLHLVFRPSQFVRTLMTKFNPRTSLKHFQTRKSPVGPKLRCATTGFSGCKVAAAN